MLTKLQIQNYAIIEQIEINFSDGLTIITGETGAGKSILMGALNLILGERADASVLLNKEKKCVIEGYFSVAQKQSILNFLSANELDNDAELVIRREIALNGKSRAFVNDTPVSLQQLKNLSSMLVDLHQQFDTLELGDAGFQRNVLDAIAGNQQLLNEYNNVFRQWQQEKKKLQELENQKAAFTKELDYNRFLFDELDELQLKENELENLDQELQVLSHAEAIKNSLSAVHYNLNESEQPVILTIKQLLQQLQSFTNYNAEIKALTERLLSTQIELKDIADEAERINDHIQFDVQKIDLINERLAAGYKLLKKHGVTSTDELITIREQLKEKLQAVLQIDDTLTAQSAQVKALHEQAVDLAAQLHNNRHKTIPSFEKNVNALLQRVGMPNAIVKAELTPVDLNAYGADEIQFLFDANKSNRFMPLSKVASGGELSRLMLCIKSLVAGKIDLPTMIFDEIDTGISGEAAKQVGMIMKDLSLQRQIICITHQPQIAGKAKQHLFVYKNIVNDKVQTGIRQLSNEERITIIAQMLSGEKPTAAALENAREMIMN